MFKSFPSPRKVYVENLKNICIQGGSSSLAHLLLDLAEDLLFQFSCVILLQHVILPPRLCPFLRMLHLLRGQAQVKADALDIELGSLPAFRPRFGTHLYFDLEDADKCQDNLSRLNKRQKFEDATLDPGLFSPCLQAPLQ